MAAKQFQVVSHLEHTKQITENFQSCQKSRFRKEKLYGMQAYSEPVQIASGWSPSCCFCAALGGHTSYFKINPWIHLARSNPSLDWECWQTLSLNHVFAGIYIGNNSTVMDISKWHDFLEVCFFLNCSVTGNYQNYILSISSIVYIHYCFWMSPRRFIYNFGYIPLLFTKA